MAFESASDVVFQYQPQEKYTLYINVNCCRDLMVVGYITTCAISGYHY